MALEGLETQSHPMGQGSEGCRCDALWSKWALCERGLDKKEIAALRPQEQASEPRCGKL